MRDKPIGVVHDQARALVAVIDSASSASMPVERHDHVLLAFAALARCRSLLLGAADLDRAGRSDIVGVTVRALVEAWYFGVIALLGTDEDLDRFEQDHRYWKNELAKQFPGIDSEKGTSQRFSVFERAKRADELVSAIGQPAGTALDVYRVFYAAESLTNAHAGLESLKSYVVEEDGGRLGVMFEPGPNDTAYGRLRMAVVLTALLGKWTWESAGPDHTAFDELDIDVD